MIDYSYFEAAIKKLKLYNDIIDNINHFFSDYGEIFPDASFYGSTLQDEVVELLSLCISKDNHDEVAEVLCWWIWEEDFGKFIDDEMGTVEGLYNHLKGEYCDDKS